MLNFENLNKCIFQGTGHYNIPEIAPETDIPIHKLEWIPFNYAKSCKNPQGKGIHFYVDDYQFVRLWNFPDTYIPLLQRFDAVCTPDFSQYTDMPAAMRIYNHYRKHWLGAYWQMHGIRVIPTICWSDADSFAWCFDGEPKNSIVSISSVGTQNNKQVAEAFEFGCREALKRLNPSQILWYGKCPAEFDWNVVTIRPHQDEIVERRKAKSMGGRGSSGRTAKSFSVGPTRPVELDLPALSGSTRQVQYAQDILNRGYDALGQAARSEESIMAQLGAKATQDNLANQRAQAYRAAQSRYAEQVKSLKRLGTMQASQIINQRTGLERIARNLAEDEFKKRKLSLSSINRNI